MLKSEPLFNDSRVPSSGKEFRQFYADSVMRMIDNNLPHPTLGANIKEGSPKKGSKVIARLCASLEISPDDTVVDYGCGTLRLGRHLIEYLHVGKYVGADIDKRLLDFGRNLLSESQLDKKPLLEVISETSIRSIAEMNPRWVFSFGVLHHIPPDDLCEYFGNIAQLIHSEGSQAIVRHKLSDVTQKFNPISWQFSVETLLPAIHSSGLVLHPIDPPRNGKSSLLQLTKINQEPSP